MQVSQVPSIKTEMSAASQTLKKVLNLDSMLQISGCFPLGGTSEGLSPGKAASLGVPLLGILGFSLQ